MRPVCGIRTNNLPCTLSPGIRRSVAACCLWRVPRAPLPAQLPASRTARIANLPACRPLPSRAIAVPSPTASSTVHARSCRHPPNFHLAAKVAHCFKHLRQRHLQRVYVGRFCSKRLTVGLACCYPDYVVQLLAHLVLLTRPVRPP